MVEPRAAEHEFLQPVDERLAVDEGELEVDWDDDTAEFSYRDPGGGRALLELLPTPSWHELQYRG